MYNKWEKELLEKEEKKLFWQDVTGILLLLGICAFLVGTICAVWVTLIVNPAHVGGFK